jgi:hypothetical protein
MKKSKLKPVELVTYIYGEKVLSETYFEDEFGRKQGVCKMFSYRKKKKQLIQIYHYRDDKKNGLAITYVDDLAVGKGNYKDDLKDGEWHFTYTDIFKNGVKEND